MIGKSSNEYMTITGGLGNIHFERYDYDGSDCF